MYGIEFHEDIDITAYHFSLWLMERGVLTKPTKKNILRWFLIFYLFYFRLTPPISISTDELNLAVDVIINVILNAEKLLLDNLERPSPTFNFPMVDESYSKMYKNICNEKISGVTSEKQGKIYLF